MNRLVLKILSALLAAALALSSAAFASPAPKSPEGYNAHDYERVLAFLEQEDGYGVKNGAKLSSAYDPLDPETWNADAPRFSWTETDDGNRLAGVSCEAVHGMLCGALDLSGCAALVSINCGDSNISSVNVSGCAALAELVCKNCRIASLNTDGCSALRLLNCANNSLTALSLSGCPELRFLECRWNQIAELAPACCPGLTVLICTDNRLKELDLSGNPLLGGLRLLRMADPGEQYISCFIAEDPEYASSPEYFVSADCYGSCSSYAGWFTEDGRLVAEHTTFDPRETNSDSFVARFELGALPGDADSDGEVTVADALRILRASMGLVSGNTGSGYDVNADGAVSVTDALLILRRCMGLFF